MLLLYVYILINMIHNIPIFTETFFKFTNGSCEMNNIIYFI